MNLIPWRNKELDRTPDRFGDSSLATLREEMGSLFDRFMRDPWGLSPLEGFFPSNLGPRIDMSESDTEICLKAELPGVDPKDVDIQIEGDILTIRGEKHQEKTEKKRNYHWVERQYGAFHRSVPLPASADSNKVEAAYKDGVLTVTIQKNPDAQPRRITVRNA
jgi:HSP20 family protein